MKPIKNTEPHDLKIDFEGTSYILPMGKVVLVENKLHDYLKENLPLAFAFNPTTEKNKPVPQAESSKTPVRLPMSSPRSDMVVTNGRPTPTFGNPDITPESGTTDKDGVNWYGEGLEVDNLGN